jgi:hypothetical protein
MQQRVYYANITGLYEGDIAMSYSEVVYRNLTNSETARHGKGGKTRNAIRRRENKWQGGVIPYTISPAFNSYERGVIAKAMKEYHDNTCLK